VPSNRIACYALVLHTMYADCTYSLRTLHLLGVHRCTWRIAHVDTMTSPITCLAFNSGISNHHSTKGKKSENTKHENTGEEEDKEDKWERSWKDNLVPIQNVFITQFSNWILSVVCAQCACAPRKTWWVLCSGFQAQLSSFLSTPTTSELNRTPSPPSTSPYCLI